MSTSSLASNEAYTTVLKQYVHVGNISNDDLVSSEYPIAMIPYSLDILQSSKLQLETALKTQSSLAAPDLDGWIEQARSLQSDILATEHSSKMIAHAHETLAQHRLDLVDVSRKVELLEGEISFTSQLSHTLHRLQGISRKLDKLQEILSTESTIDIAHELEETKLELIDSSLPQSMSAQLALEQRISSLHVSMTTKLRDCWRNSVRCNKIERSVTIIQASHTNVSMGADNVIKAMVDLGTFDIESGRFCDFVYEEILAPRLSMDGSNRVHRIASNNNVLNSSVASDDLSAELLFSDLTTLVEFLTRFLPKNALQHIAAPISSHLLPHLIDQWLYSAVPNDLQQIDEFNTTVGLVQKFGIYLTANGWPGEENFNEWITSIPQIWLKKRQEQTLGDVRQMLSAGVTEVQRVERSETRTLAQTDEVFGDGKDADDWNASWSDEEAVTEPVQVSTRPVDVGQEDEDTSAWDGEKEVSKDGSIEEDTAAWGWGDEDEGNIASSPVKEQARSPRKIEGNRSPELASDASRVVTLKETLKTSQIPDHLLSAIRQSLHDAASLSNTSKASILDTVETAAVLQIPGLILALYRAGTFLAYESTICGNILIYNDTLWLAEEVRQLKGLVQKILPDATPDWPNFAGHALTLESHGKRAYSKEMEIQRIILNDLMDGAQGFNSCTQNPFNQECDIAIASSVDHVNTLYKQWQDILSQSALLQSMGSLVNSLCIKMIQDIEDMSDISEPESQQLARYCARIATLESRFMPESGQALDRPSTTEEEEPTPVAGLYVPKWFKFQYLANVLESSLADIKYMWTEGELSLEFETVEIIDLIIALFADSSHRKTAIQEIKSYSRRS